MSLRSEFVKQLDGDWSVDMGVLVCPCGHRIEDDGRCPNGHESPIPI